MDMDTRIAFKVKGLGFPSGQIYRMYIWFEGHKENAGKWVEDNSDNIKKQMETTCHVHSIEFEYVTYTNSHNKDEKYGDLILDKTIRAIPKVKKTKNDPNSKVTKINRIDFPNIDSQDLRIIRYKARVELFKREHKISDAVYEFFKENKDLVTIEEVIKITDEYGADDLFLLKKRKIREQVEKKLGKKIINN